MKIYSKKHLVLGLVFLGFVLFDFYELWTKDDTSALFFTAVYLLLAFAEFRAAFSKKHALAALIAENDELEKVKQLKADRLTFWACVYFLILLSCLLEKNQPIVAYGVLASAGLLLLLRLLFGIYYELRLRQEV